MNVDKISNRANTELRMWMEVLSQALKDVAKVEDEESRAQKAIVTTKGRVMAVEHSHK